MPRPSAATAACDEAACGLEAAAAADASDTAAESKAQSCTPPSQTWAHNRFVPPVTVVQSPALGAVGLCLRDTGAPTRTSGDKLVGERPASS